VLLDVPAIVRGGSRGFSVLLVGELLALAVGAFVGALGGLLFAISAAAGPITAGTVAGRVGPPLVQGACAGLLAYGLTVPLRMLTGSRGIAELAFSVVASTALGALGGRTVARASGGSGQPNPEGDLPI
jgi:hypothetical protein